MKNITLLILSGLLIASCSACNKMMGFNEFGGEQTHEYDYLFTQFNADVRTLGHQTLDFSKTKVLLTDEILKKYNADGFCPGLKKSNNDETTLYVSSRFRTLTKTQQKYVMYHEIGHCFYGLPHKKGGLMTEAMGTLSMQENDLLFYLKGMLEESNQ